MPLLSQLVDPVDNNLTARQDTAMGQSIRKGAFGTEREGSLASEALRRKCPVNPEVVHGTTNRKPRVGTPSFRMTGIKFEIRILYTGEARPLT